MEKDVLLVTILENYTREFTDLFSQALSNDEVVEAGTLKDLVHQTVLDIKELYSNAYN